MVNKFSQIILAILFFISAAFPKDDALKQQLNNRVKSFLGVDSLSSRQQAGFTYQLTLMEIYDQLTPELQKEAMSQINVQAPIRQFSIQSPSTKFTLHYDTNGLNAVPTEDVSGNGIPDYIDSAAVFLDYVWQVTIDEIGFQAPLNESGQPVSTYHIYFSSIPYYGVTYTESAIGADRYTSYIELHNTMQASHIKTKGLNGLRVTAAHEFHHAVELGYRFRNEDRFFFEMTGTWMEDVIYPDINDYFFYLDGFFSRIQAIPFTSTIGDDPYANGLYLHMLSQIYGNQIVLDIWKEIVRQKAMDALETVLDDNNSSFSESLNEYAKWLYFTGQRSIPGEFFTDASSFDMITIPVQGMLNSNLIVKHNFLVTRESFYYFTIDSVFTLAGLTDIDVGTNNAQVQISYFNSEKYYTTSAESGVRHPVIIESIPQDLIFTVSNTRDSTINVSFTMLTDSTIIPREKGSSVAYGPNPTNINDGTKSANFWAVPAFAKIVIMDFNQQPIRELQNDEYFDTPVTWDLKDKNGKLVSSGIYFYVVNGKGKTQIDKIAIIR